MALGRNFGKRGATGRRTAHASVAALVTLGLSAFGAPAAQAAGHSGAAKSSRSAGSQVVLTAWTSSRVGRVRIVDDSYSPKTLVVRVGTTVVWTNTDNDSHTVTRSSRNPLDSGTLKAGKTYRFTFHRPGRYIYHCEYHSFMRGAVIVLPAGYDR